MISCDNDGCPIGWWHYPCANVESEPNDDLNLLVFERKHITEISPFKDSYGKEKYINLHK